MNKIIDYESLFTYISLILAFAIFIVLMYGCIADHYGGSSIIERFSTTEPEHAEISSITVDPDTKAILTITLGAKKGKYYKDKPPTITIDKPDVANSTQAEATAKLKDTSIAGTAPELYEIDSITITTGKGGTKYETTDVNKIKFESIETYKTANSPSESNIEPIRANINTFTVKSDTKGIETITLTSRGKYFAGKPPLITIGAPEDNTGTVAKADVKLKTTPIVANGKFYEIESIDITVPGGKYVVADDLDKIVLETIAEYESRVNPIITLNAEQKTTIKGLIDNCSALSNKQPYISKIDGNNLKKIDVEDIIKEVSPNT